VLAVAVVPDVAVVCCCCGACAVGLLALGFDPVNLEIPLTTSFAVEAPWQRQLDQHVPEMCTLR